MAGPAPTTPASPWRTAQGGATLCFRSEGAITGVLWQGQGRAREEVGRARRLFPPRLEGRLTVAHPQYLPIDPARHVEMIVRGGWCAGELRAWRRDERGRRRASSYRLAPGDRHL